MRVHHPSETLRAAALLLGLLVASVLRADDAPDPQHLVRPRLIAETSALQRGKTGWLAVHLTMKPGWHTYWRNPGDAGLATSIKWTLPQGVTAGPIFWPAPEKFVTRTIVGFGYPDEVALLTAVKVPAAFPFDNVAIAATVSWLACEKVCIPGSETLAIALPVAEALAPADPRNAKVFAQARRRIPQPAPFKATFDMDAEQIRIRIPSTALPDVAGSQVMFYPFDNSTIEHAAPQKVVVRQGEIELILRQSPAADETMQTLDGLLIVGHSGGRSSRALDISAGRAEIGAKR